MDIQPIIDRLRLDIETINQHRDRTGTVAEKNLRWVGPPHGWRTMGHQAQDIELLLNHLMKKS